MDIPVEESYNQSTHERQQTVQKLIRNAAANNAYIQQYYPNENFISNTKKYQLINEYTKNIIIPENVKIAESRIPKSLKQKSDLIDLFKNHLTHQPIIVNKSAD